MSGHPSRLCDQERAHLGVEGGGGLQMALVVEALQHGELRTWIAEEGYNRRSTEGARRRSRTPRASAPHVPQSVAQVGLGEGQRHRPCADGTAIAHDRSQLLRSLCWHGVENGPRIDIGSKASGPVRAGADPCGRDTTLGSMWRCCGAGHRDGDGPAAGIFSPDCPKHHTAFRLGGARRRPFVVQRGDGGVK